MFAQVSWISALAGLSLGVAWLGTSVEVDVREDPPLIVCDGNWVSDCERVQGGLSLTVHEAPDLLFFFEGVDDLVTLGHAVYAMDGLEPLFSGEGTYVPLSS